MAWRIHKGARIHVREMLEPDINVMDSLPYTTEDVVCAHFGCSRILSLIEQLAGKYCTAHMNTKPIDINLIIRRT